jgi:hypothetical protein
LFFAATVTQICPNSGAGREGGWRGEEVQG